MNISESKKAGDIAVRLKRCVTGSLKAACTALSDDILEIVNAAEKIPETEDGDAVVAFRISVIKLWESYHATQTLISQCSCVAAWEALAETKECIKEAKSRLNVVKTERLITCY